MLYFSAAISSVTRLIVACITTEPEEFTAEVAKDAEADAEVSDESEMSAAPAPLACLLLLSLSLCDPFSAVYSPLPSAPPLRSPRPLR